MRSRNFRLLVTCNVISVAGSAVSFVAIPFAVLGIGGSASDVGYVATAELIPLIVFLLLGGVVADSRPGGARSWGFIVAAYSGGAVIGGLIMIRFRPRRILTAAILSVPAFSLLLFALAVPLAVPLDAGAAFLAGGCLEVFAVSWATTLQQEIPPDRLSRVSSYDALGSYALTPVGTAIAGPLAAAFGISAVLTAGGALIVLFPLLVLLVPEVRDMRRQ